MVKETVQSLKAENDELKEKVDTVHDTLLRILSEENDHYIDLPDLITKISWKLGFLYLQCTWL